MQDPPRPDFILELVAGFLRNEVMPKLSGSAAFDVRVCANAVDLVRRQMQLAPASDAAEAGSQQIPAKPICALASAIRRENRRVGQSEQISE